MNINRTVRCLRLIKMCFHLNSPQVLSSHNHVATLSRVCQLIAKPNLQLYRYKQKKVMDKQKTDAEEEEVSEIDFMDKSTVVKTVSVESLRIDAVLKAGLGIARRKVENIFYESKIRLNGEKVLKKSAHVNVGDEIDIIRGFSSANPEFLVVSRIELLSALAEEESINIKFRRSKSLIIENYSDPWKQSTSSP